MSQVASSYVRRHVQRHPISKTKKLALGAVANAADDQGVTHRFYQHDVAEGLGLQLRTIKRAFSGLLRPPEGSPGPFLEKLGNGRYRLLGLAGHDPRSCGDLECLAELRAVPDFAGETRAEKKRRQGAARARAFRAKQRAAQQL